MKEENINPRYKAYALSNDNTVEEQKEIDAKKYPGGVMLGFMNYMTQKWLEFERLHPECIGCHAAFTQEFDEFLKNQYPDAYGMVTH